MIVQALKSIKKKYKTHKAKSVLYKDKEDSYEGAFVVNESCKSDAQQEEWLIESGASKHMTWNKESLQNYQEFSEPQTVKLGDGRVVEALGLGNITMKMSFRVSDGKDVTMYDVLYVPKLSMNLFSVGAAAKKGNTVKFKRTHCYIRGKNGALHGMGTQRSDGLYQLDIEGNCTTCHGASTASVPTSMWHQRLGHTTNLKKVKNLVKVFDTIFTNEEEDIFCEACVEGKLSRKPYKSVGEIRSKRKLQLVHSDVCGPFQTESLGGKKYFH